MRKEFKANIQFTEFRQQQTRKRAVQEILYQLFNNADDILPRSFLDRLARICTEPEQSTAKNKAANEKNVLSRLQLLDEFENSLCGNVYRNSIKSSHLERYVLRRRIENTDIEPQNLEALE